MTTRKLAGRRRRPRKKGLPDWLAAVSGDRVYDWALKAWDRAAAVPGAWFDDVKAQGVVDLWPKIFRLTEDRFAGVPFRLNTWQEIIVRLLFGWRMPEEITDPQTGETVAVHVRIFRRLLLWIPRKNGKSEFLVALALAFAALDPVAAGQGYVFARDEDQAMIPFRKMKTMVSLSPDLSDEIQTHAKSIWIKPAATAVMMLTGSEHGLHGKSPTVILGDEMHEWKSREIENILHGGTSGRLEPIELYASTAGLKTNPTGVELWDESIELLDGTRTDPSTLVAMFAADPAADWEDEAVWEAANPSLGLSPTRGYLRREAMLAKDNPRKEAQFKCYHLNIWVDGEMRWLNMARWDRCSSAKQGWKVAAEKMRGRRCFAGIDVSATQDVTALVWLFPPTAEDPIWHIVSRFWIPEDTVAQRVKNDRVPYDKFVASGAMETTRGDFVNQNAVADAVLEGMELFDVERIGFDSWNSSKLIADLQDEIEPEMFVQVRQGIPTLGEPSKNLERLMYARLIDHGNHPVLRWMAGNAVVRFDENLNFAPGKKRSREKIDGISATVTALAVAMAGGDDESGLEDFVNRLKQENASA